MKKVLVLLSIMTMLMLVACGGGNKESINVYNAGEYIDPETIKMFENETGIKVVYDTFASNEDLYVKLTQGADQYDVVVPSDYMIERLIKEDRLEKIDFTKIPNSELVNAQFKHPEYDPNNEYSVPYFSGTLGIVYNKTMVSKPVTSWADLWDITNKGQIIMYDSQRDSIAVALAKLGYSLNSTNPEELEAAKKALIDQKPLVSAYLTDNGRDVVVQGEAAMAVMYSGDAALMISENPDLDYVVPSEGSNIWIDAFVIPKGTQHKEAAEKFIDFMSKPEISAKNAEYLVGYTSPIDGVKEFLPEELSKSEVAYPDYTKLPKLETFRDLGDNVDLYDRVWTEVSATMSK